MLLAILSICNQKEPVDADAESDEMDTADTTEDLAVRRQIIKNKNLAVGRCGRYSSTRYVFFVYPDFFPLSFSFSFRLSPMTLRHLFHLLLNHAPFFSRFAVATRNGHWSLTDNLFEQR